MRSLANDIQRIQRALRESLDDVYYGIQELVISRESGRQFWRSLYRTPDESEARERWARMKQEFGRSVKRTIRLWRSDNTTLDTFTAKAAKPIREAAEADTTLTIIARDPDGTLRRLLECIRKTGNGGHSFSIVVDPDIQQGLSDRKFFWDGDGSDYIADIKG